MFQVSSYRYVRKHRQVGKRAAVWGIRSWGLGRPRERPQRALDETAHELRSTRRIARVSLHAPGGTKVGTWKKTRRRNTRDNMRCDLMCFVNVRAARIRSNGWQIQVPSAVFASLAHPASGQLRSATGTIDSLVGHECDSTCTAHAGRGAMNSMLVPSITSRHLTCVPVGGYLHLHQMPLGTACTIHDLIFKFPRTVKLLAGIKSPSRPGKGEPRVGCLK